MITPDNINGLNFEKIHKRSKELETFPEMLPRLIRNNLKNPEKRWEYLQKKGLYKQILKQQKNSRKELKKSKNKSQYLINELITWINKNPKFTDLINIKQNQ